MRPPRPSWTARYGKRRRSLSACKVGCSHLRRSRTTMSSRSSRSWHRLSSSAVDTAWCNVIQCTCTLGSGGDFLCPSRRPQRTVLLHKTHKSHCELRPNVINAAQCPQRTRSRNELSSASRERRPREVRSARPPVLSRYMMLCMVLWLVYTEMLYRHNLTRSKTLRFVIWLHFARRVRRRAPECRRPT
jgi:hypothetical protein